MGGVQQGERGKTATSGEKSLSEQRKLKTNLMQEVKNTHEVTSGMFGKWTLLPKCSYLTEWACRWSQPVWVKGIQQKCTWTHLLSSERKNIKNLCWHVNHTPDSTFPHFLHFHCPIKPNCTSGAKLVLHTEERVFCNVVSVLCYTAYKCWGGGCGPEVTE